ncbi:MAG: hypothetical protein H5U02_11390 [Clostridia bacterium]|nr:hypothetical protein [Clostridia bacterium]
MSSRRSWLEVELRITTLGPARWGSGFRSLEANSTVVRGQEGRLVIPGSTIKGSVRKACEQLAGALGVRHCIGTRPEKLCREKPCIICNLMGSPSFPSRLYFSDAHCQTSPETKDQRWESLYGLRTRVSISRRLGTAVGRRLFTTEHTIESPMMFCASISGSMASTIPPEEEIPLELRLLVGSLKLVNSLGGGRSLGFGRCQVTISRLTLDHKEIKPESIWEDWDSICLYDDCIAG